ncbi:translocase [Malaciobacter halophilus]|uniref:Translocase n=2 Tax=Malaciobacter halophilus TaxID=197482 RepID=A0A2N1J5M2_9BACT|nr:polysaccharide biosynthesis protein [Malaciobacter halophilus]PKI81843.1 translocase [Malaciobacter halophilus]
MTGTTIAQAIPIAISPILTRIYTPEDFGVLSLFVAITAIFGSIANGRYELAIMLPKKDEDAINIFALGFIITVVISLILLIIITLFNDYFTKLLDNEDISFWLYFIPLTVFFVGLWNILNYFNNRKKNYKDIANATIIKSIIQAIIQLSLGFLKNGAVGLISGNILSQFFANTKLLVNIIKDKVLISNISKVKIIALAKKYKDFPKFTLWAGLANTSSKNITNIFISTFYGIVTLGYYSLVQRVLEMPASLVGGSIGQVFFQEAVEEKKRTGTSIVSFKKTFKRLLILSIAIFPLIYFFIEDIFIIVFGEAWKEAGEYARIILFLVIVQFIVSPLTAINQVYMKNKNVMYWQLGLLTLHIVILYSSYYLKIAFIDYLRYMVVYISLYYIFHLYLLQTYIMKDKNE